MSRFRLGSPGTSRDDARYEQVELAKRQADPGYQFLNAGLSTLAKTLGSLAVNAANYELFGGRKKDDLAAKNLQLAESQFAFNRDKFRQDMDLRNKTFDENKRKAELTSAIGSAEGLAKNFASRAHLMDKDVVDAAMARFTGPKKTGAIKKTVPIPRPIKGPEAFSGTIPAAEITTREAVPEGREGDYQQVEAVDYFANLNPDQRKDANSLSFALDGIKVALDRLPDGVEKEAATASILGQLGVSAAGADKLRDVFGKTGSSVTASRDQTSASRTRAPSRAARDDRFWTGQAKEAAGFYRRFEQAMNTRSAVQREAIVPGFDKKYGTKEAQQKELARRLKSAQEAQKKSRGRSGELGIAILTPADEKALIPASGRRGAAKRTANKATYYENIKGDPIYAESQYAIGFRKIAPNLKGLSDNQKAIVANPESTDFEVLTVFDNYRNGLESKEEKGKLSVRLLDTAFLIQRKELDAPGKGSGKPAKLTNDEYFKKIGRETSFSKLKRLKGPTKDADIAEIRGLFEAKKITGPQFSTIVDRYSNLSTLMEAIRYRAELNKQGAN